MAWLGESEIIGQGSSEFQAGSPTETWKSAPCQTVGELMTETVDMNVQWKVTASMTNHHLTNCFFVASFQSTEKHRVE